MSRVGKKVIEVPKDVKVNVTNSVVEVQGPKGTLTTPIPPGPPLVIVLSSVSGGGKDAVRDLLRDWGLPLYFAVTATTRPTSIPPMRTGSPPRTFTLLVTSAFSVKWCTNGTPRLNA